MESRQLDESPQLGASGCWRLELLWPAVVLLIDLVTNEYSFVVGSQRVRPPIGEPSCDEVEDVPNRIGQNDLILSHTTS